MDEVRFFMELGERVKARRKELGLTKVQLNEMSGVHRCVILRIERGCSASLMSCLKLEYALGLKGLIHELADRFCSKDLRELSQ